MSHFDFRQFRICHDRCSMKVGTDGVLLGAWAEVEGAQRILDIGTGSGLIALMAAQRSKADVLGIDIHVSSVEQARENVESSPYASRVHIEVCDVRSFSPDQNFDCVLSNPPYFEEDLLPPNEVRAGARHTQGLPFAECIANAHRLLCDGGSFQVILPHTAATRFIALCIEQGFSLQRSTEVHTVSHKPPRRTLLHFVKTLQLQNPVQRNSITLTAADGSRSEDYKHLTQDFYL